MILITTKFKLNQVYPEPISASIVENNYVDLNTKQVITEEKYFQKSFILTGDTSTYNWQDIVKFNGEPVEGDYNRVGSIRFSTNLTTQAHTVELNAITKGENDTNASFGTISVTINPDKTVTTYAPTPSTNDNSTKIATTAYVKSNLNNYLPLSGGTMTGELFLETQGHRIFSLTGHGGSTTDEAYTNVDFGWNYGNADGAGAAFRSSDWGNGTSVSSGEFDFYARNSSGDTAHLVGQTSGALYWTGTQMKIGSASTSSVNNAGGCILQYNSTNQCLDFVFP